MVKHGGAGFRLPWLCYEAETCSISHNCRMSELLSFNVRRKVTDGGLGEAGVIGGNEDE
jgi:hypothetical protein